MSMIGHNSGPTPPMWIYLVRRFEQLIENLAITETQLQNGFDNQANVRRTLNRHYWGVDSDTANSRLIGSWGKQLRVRPPRDVDVLFTLPWSVYHRFEARSGNRQSQLLQEVRGVLAADNQQSTLRGDGQVVVALFASAPVEVVPAFAFEDGQFWICDTNDGGIYRVTDPAAELASLDDSDLLNNGATRRLIRIMKQWQRHCDVPIKSFQIERAAIEFLWTWPHSRDLFWVDWMIRDFFAYLVSRQNQVMYMPGTGSAVAFGNGWVAKAQAAHEIADRAFYLEQFNHDGEAGAAWQSLFGVMIPGFVA